MSSFENNENNNAFWYDKIEFYAENGLSKGKKKDSKSRSLKERERAEKRDKKVADIVSTLPNKMQKKLIEETNHTNHMAPTKSSNHQGKTKHKKVIHSVEKNTSEDVGYNEEDYFEKEEVAISNKDYEMGLAMWIKYGLTKERYDADLEHRANIAALDAYYADPESYLAPRYGDILKEKIRKYEEDAIAREIAAEEEEDLYPDFPAKKMELDDPYEDYMSFFEYEDEEDMAERYRLERLEMAIENARDDLWDDY